MEAIVRRFRTYTSGYRLAMHIRDKWGMRHPKYGATGPLAYAINPSPSKWHARINEGIRIELEPIGMRAALLTPERRYDVVRDALRRLPDRSKLALDARLARAFGQGHNPIVLISDLVGQPDGLPRLYGALTWNGEPHPTTYSAWGSAESQPRRIPVLTGNMLDDFLIRSLQTTLLTALEYAR
jgi:hypothetical protein